MLVTIDDLLKQIRTYNAVEEPLIYKAYQLADSLHAGAIRESGDPYISHPLAVAYILSLMKADRDTICASLLHDAVEDTNITLEGIARYINPEVAFLVDGVTKMRKLDYSSPEEAEIATIRKIIMSMMKDPRILLIKLADRLHNMQTLEYKKNKLRQKQFAIETLDYFSPLAYAIGAYDIKTELEDLAFKFAMPDDYTDIMNKKVVFEQYSETLLNDMLNIISEALYNEGIPNELKIKIKNAYRIYQSQTQSIRLTDMHDLMTMRVVVDNVKNCYIALGIIHDKCKQTIDSDFKDFISKPKPNLYQSLHTTLIGPRSKMIQAHIRDQRMSQFASYGLGAYWGFYQGMAKSEMMNDFTNKMPFYTAINDIDNYYSDNTEFVSQIKQEVFENYIYIDTAAGETKELPVSSTILDFAYKIHSDIGNQFISATVNDEIVPIDYILQNRDRVRIITGASSMGPDETWLQIAHTTHAKEKIRRYLRNKNN